MASIVGIRAGVGGIAYSTAKAAVLHLTRCAAVELGEHGICVNSISPGPIATGIFGKGSGREDNAADDEADVARAIFEKFLARGRSRSVVWGPWMMLLTPPFFWRATARAL